MRKKIHFLITMAVILLIPAASFALTATSEGGFLYELLSGAGAFIVGTIVVVVGAVFAIRSKLLLAIPSILVGAFLLKADAILPAIGALIGH